jgi:prepilin-type N-terminal cleavage/methylation domain-containing protein
MYKRKQNQADAGFTLIEVAIVIIILGIISAALTSSLLSYIKRSEIRSTESKLLEIDSALQTFLELNGRYPCPASLTVQQDTANFGVEISAGNCSTAGAVVGTTSVGSNNGAATNVRIGAVPVRTLNLPDDYIMDAWGNRFTLAMTEGLATAGTYSRDLGGVSIIDSNGNSVVQPADTAHYMIVSHGDTGLGATALGGGAAPACNPATLDGENCDNDSTFRDTLLTGTGAAANFFDDHVRRNVSTFVNIPPGAVVAFNGGCPPGWIPFLDAGGNPISGRVIIAAGNYAGNYDNGKHTWNYNNAYDLYTTGGYSTWHSDSEEIQTHPQVAPNPVDTASLSAAFPGTEQLVRANTSVIPANDVTLSENVPPWIALNYCEKQ